MPKWLCIINIIGARMGFSSLCARLVLRLEMGYPLVFHHWLVGNTWLFPSTSCPQLPSNWLSYHSIYWGWNDVMVLGATPRNENHCYYTNFISIFKESIGKDLFWRVALLYFYLTLLKTVWSAISVDVTKQLLHE